MTDPIRVLLVDDHDMVREALAAALAVYDDVHVASLARSLAEAARAIERGGIDVIVTDLKLRDGEGASLPSVAARTPGNPPVLLITGTDDRLGIRAAIDGGCAGFVSKETGFDRLVDAVRVVARGGAVFPADLLGAALRPAQADDRGLSVREQEVLELLARARSVGQIADELYVSPHTVRNHVRQILTKLGAHTQLEAVVIAARDGLVDIA